MTWLHWIEAVVIVNLLAIWLGALLARKRGRS